MIIKIDKYTVLIDDNAMIEIIAQQNGSHKKECGGIILGSVTNDCRIIIRSIPKATNDNKASKCSCVRDKRIAQAIIDDVFKRTDGAVTYLGEWHTHPVDVPTYSSQDQQTIKEQFLLNVITTEFLLMLIIGRKNLELSIYSNKELVSVNKEIASEHDCILLSQV